MIIAEIGPDRYRQAMRDKDFDNKGMSAVAKDWAGRLRAILVIMNRIRDRDAHNMC